MEDILIGQSICGRLLRWPAHLANESAVSYKTRAG